MSDLIDRQAAIDALGTPHGILYPIRTIEALPSAEPISQIKWERDTAISQLKELGYGLGEKPRKGKWMKYIPPVDDDDGKPAYDCSECLAMVSKPCNFCPNCGADMRGEEDE